jgi:hypothetical protein
MSTTELIETIDQLIKEAKKTAELIKKLENEDE